MNEKLEYTKVSIQDKLVMKYTDFISITEFNIDMILNRLRLSYVNPIQSVKDILSEKPLFILNQLFDEIYSENLEVEFSFDMVQEIGDEVYQVSIDIELDNYSVLTGVSYNGISIYYEEDDDISSNVASYDLRIINFNNFTGQIRLEGRIDINSSDTHFDIVNDLRKTIHLSISGLRKDFNKSWFESIIHGSIYYEANNMRMAYFNIFSGLDDFITRIYNVLFDTFVDEYSSLIKSAYEYEFEKTKKALFESENEKLDNSLNQKYRNSISNDEIIKLLEEQDDSFDIRDYDGKEDELAELYEDYVDDIYEEGRQALFSSIQSGDYNKVIYEQISVNDVEDYLKDSIRTFANDNIRLREKIGICSEVVGMIKPKNHHTQYKNYYTLLKKFGYYEKQRHDIAHGRSVDIRGVDELLYFALNIILSITQNYDFESEGWDFYVLKDADIY
jgi:hypothetical protein